MGRTVQERTTPRNNHANKTRAPDHDTVCQTPWQIWKNKPSNVVVFQGSAIIALLFTIYLDDMMEDYRAINRKEKLPTRFTLQRHQEKETKQLLENIANLAPREPEILEIQEQTENKCANQKNKQKI